MAQGPSIIYLAQESFSTTNPSKSKTKQNCNPNLFQSLSQIALQPRIAKLQIKFPANPYPDGIEMISV